MRCMWIGAVALCALQSGCASEADQAPPTMTVTDSAGLRIVTHTALPAASIRLGAGAVLTIGAQPEELTLYRVSGGRLLEGGDFLIADAGNLRVLRFSSAGDVVAEFGGEGEGPGEFRGMSWMHRLGDGWATYDARARRVTRFDLSGEVLATIPYRPETPEPPSDDAVRTSGAVLGVTTSGRLIGYPAAFADMRGTEGPLPLLADIHMYDTTSTAVDSLGSFTLMEWFEDPTRPGSVGNQLGAGRIYWAGDNDRLAITHPSAYQVSVFESGVYSMVIREAAARLPFAPDSVPEMYHSAVDSLPAYQDVRVDSRGQVWVKPSAPEGQASVLWRVFAADGGGVAALEVPADAVVLDASDTHLLLLRYDEFDAETVELWPVEADDD